MEPPLLSISRTRRTSLFLTLVPVAFTAVFALSAEARFLLRAGGEEARILLKRRPIAELTADPATRPELRAQLDLVLAARRFAAERLGLAANDTYTTFSDVGRGTTLLHVVSASPPGRLEAYRWSYPIVGAVPYKGFFEREDALAEERRLKDLGYDTYVRPAGAFSTLGWLPDPLLSTALDGDPAELVATVIHEIAHNTLWVQGDARFNESYANFVGYRGAEAFFAGRGDLATAARCAATWRDEKRLAAFYTALETELNRLYSARLSGPVREERRQEIFQQARAAMAGPLGRTLEVYDGGRLSRRPLNNAWLIAHQTYSTGLDELDRLYEIENRDLRAGVRQLAHSIRRYRSLRPIQALALTLQAHGPMAVPARQSLPAGGSEEKVATE
jgi:predicted aminopeptidase